ncbi:MAG: septum formation initiator family protein [Sphingobacteriales bacterium]|nr:MAG: septum formation initiator family protein [Sphingobacteriales bacterium]TAF82413.1 MAG: septum formation initiator family protein [Sphingobacteriales bacterium]
MVRLLNLIKNKYFIASLAFLVWMFFFDRNDLIAQFDYRADLEKLKNEKEFYIQEISKVQKDLIALTTNQQKLEKFAREKYLMKKNNEDIFVIVEQKKNKD